MGCYEVVTYMYTKTEWIFFCSGDGGRNLKLITYARPASADTRTEAPRSRREGVEEELCSPRPFTPDLRVWGNAVSPPGGSGRFFAFLSQKKPHEALLYRASVSTSKFCVASAANPRRDRHRCIVIISPVKTPPWSVKFMVVAASGRQEQCHIMFPPRNRPHLWKITVIVTL